MGSETNASIPLAAHGEKQTHDRGPVIELEGAILAGGQSRRMGRDKATLTLGGETLISRCARAMAPLVTRTRLIGSGSPATSGHPVQPDLRPGLGPLAGIHAALATSDAPAVLVLACDLPFVTTSFLSALSDQLRGGVDAVVPTTTDGPVPVCAIYRTTCLKTLESALDSGALRAQDLLEKVETSFIEAASIDPGGLCLTNINTPEDLERAQAIASTTTRLK